MVREVKAGALTIPVHFGMVALKKFSEEVGIEFGELFADLEKALGTLDRRVKLCLAGINDGYRKAGDQKRMTEEDLLDLLDEYPVLLEELFIIFSEQTLEMARKKTEQMGNVSERAAKLAKSLPGIG